MPLQVTSRRTASVELSKEAFMELDELGRDVIIFDCLKTLSTDVKELKNQDKIDRKRIMWVGGVFGFLGGVLAVLAKVFSPY